MKNLHTTLVSKLKELGIPVHYELMLHSGLATPCISYLELTNIIDKQSDISDISKIQYQVKIWDNEIETVQSYALQIDIALRSLGFKRVGSAELYDTKSTMIQKVLTYEVLTEETIN